MTVAYYLGNLFYSLEKQLKGGFPMAATACTHIHTRAHSTHVCVCMYVDIVLQYIVCFPMTFSNILSLLYPFPSLSPALHHPSQLIPASPVFPFLAHSSLHPLPFLFSCYLQLLQFIYSNLKIRVTIHKQEKIRSVCLSRSGLARSV